MRFSPSFLVLALASVAFATPSPCPQYCVECKDGSLACGCEARSCQLSQRSLEGYAQHCPQICITCSENVTLCSCAALKGCPA